ncbi:hypothetical protein JKP88DRAFT_348758 [Tribonema minus]|uniref:Uncharacterized protein n=1 Tax=Tribonema minus TaxID=303371 RepID=A0A836CEH1_9STRA|nr:hypothetical protein JKP88DRAFT_348758 [Tribonema minus]
MTFKSAAIFTGNTAETGGAISIKNSTLTFEDDATFEINQAPQGTDISAGDSSVVFKGKTMFDSKPRPTSSKGTPTSSSALTDTSWAFSGGKRIISNNLSAGRGQGSKSAAAAAAAAPAAFTTIVNRLKRQNPATIRDETALRTSTELLEALPDSEVDVEQGTEPAVKPVMSENCREVVRWATNLQSILDTLQGYFDKHPDSESGVDLEMMIDCEQNMRKLVKLARSHQKSNMLTQFALSRRTQSLIDEVSLLLNQAVQKLQLGLSVKAIGVNLRIDENVSLLLSAALSLELVSTDPELSSSLSSLFSAGDGPVPNMATFADAINEIQVGYINEELGDVLEGEVAEGPNGVFRLQRVHREIRAEPATVADGTPAAQERLHALDHVVVTGVDPGQVLAFSAVTALGQRWRRDSAADFAANPPPEGEGVTAQEVPGADYREWALSVRNEEGEAQRRGANQAYGNALAALAERHTRTGRYQAAIAKMAEKLAPIRLQHRPPGWKRVRSRGLRYPRRRRRHRRWRDTHRRPRRIIFFGACARFPPARRGGVAVIDRDTNARANLGMRGVYATCGVADIIPGYPPADQEEEDDTEEEESDEEDDNEEDGDEEDDVGEDGKEGGDGDEGGDGGGGGVDDGEGSGDEEGVDEEGDAIMA